MYFCRLALFIALALINASASRGAEADLQIASLHGCKLQSGQTIDNCQIGYRTFGTLNVQKSNAVLFPTWFTGTTQDLVGLVGPDKLVDPARYFVILVDALGDGVSSSPSNSKTQPRMKFPVFSIRDMVETQHRLVTETLGIERLHAVMGISMGGMQTFQWVVSYPDFMDLAIPIVGSPQLTSADLLLWTAELHAIDSDLAWNSGNYEGHPMLRTVIDIHQLALTTPEYLATNTPRQDFQSFVSKEESRSKFDWNNWHRQLEAMLSQDVAKSSSRSLEETARAVKAKMLIIPSDQDHMVNPIPAIAFSALVNSRVVRLTGDCGHIATGCEMAEFAPKVRAFIDNQ